jgi:rare lipoprotein A
MKIAGPYPLQARFGCITALMVIVLCLFAACTGSPPPSAPQGHPKPYKVDGKWYQPIPTAGNFRQQGIASWYGKKFHGRRTSNGEIYNMYAMTAAHKTLPLGTYVRVDHLDNSKSIVVRINDRGPFVHGRIIDLSYAAAKKVGIVGPGTGRVRVTALGAKADPASPKPYVPLDYDAGNFTFQVGAFSDRRNADRLRDELSKNYENAHISVYNSGETVFYRVRVGKYASLSQIIKDENLLTHQGYTDAFIVAE